MKKKVIAVILIVCMVMMIHDNGLLKSLLACCIPFIAGVATVAPFWLIGLVVYVATDGWKEAWKEFNPVSLTKETFFKKAVE